MSGPDHPHLVLASGSAIRRSMLQAVGLAPVVDPAAIDERALETDMAGSTPEALALALAVAKARQGATRHPGALVIGADQVLHHQGEVLHKAPDRETARAKLARLEGSRHTLVSAAALVRDDDVLWSGASAARLTMRPLDGPALEAYLDRAGDAATASVGAYRLEELGAALFETIEGDHFTILGLPLLPLLAALREAGLDPLQAPQGQGA